MTQLVELLRGNVRAQAQSVSDAIDDTVVASFTGTGITDADLRLVRRLEPRNRDAALDAGMAGYVDAGWRLPDGKPVRGRLVLVPDLSAMVSGQP